MTIRPHLACDYDEAKLRFPVIGMPKIDGVRGINLDGTLTGRSLKKHANKFTTARFSKDWFVGIDGELAAGDWTSPSLCRDTTSAVNRIEGEPDVVWWAFDLLDAENIGKTYIERYEALEMRVQGLNLPYLKIVPMTLLDSLEDLQAFEADCIEQGFEGVILRDPQGLHKSGRATVKVGAYMRIKRFSDAEAEVLSIVEAMQNNNEAKTNELGRTERSTHQENMVPKGMVGSLICRDLTSGETITVGAGDMDHAERKYYFDNQSEIVGQIIKYKSFRHGVKNLPRFPTFIAIRSREDMSE